MQWPNVHEEFFSFKLGFQEIVPCGRHFIVRDELSIVEYDRHVARNRYHVPLDRGDHPGIDFEHTLLGHAQNIVLQQIRRILWAKSRGIWVTSHSLAWPAFISKISL